MTNQTEPQMTMKITLTSPVMRDIPDQGQFYVSNHTGVGLVDALVVMGKNRCVVKDLYHPVGNSQISLLEPNCD